MRQAIILVGGRGTRLGVLAQHTPKPLLPIAGERVFLDYLVENIARHGFERILLLAGHMGEVVAQRYHGVHVGGAMIEVLTEPSAAGTAGALRFAAAALDSQFLMINGDCFFDMNYLALAEALRVHDIGVIALRYVEDAARYGRVETQGDRVTGFFEKDPAHSGGALISAGVYTLRRDVLDFVQHLPCSLETQVFPQLAAAGALSSLTTQGDFIDIGLPETLAEARETFPQRMRRGAVFFDRDGTLTRDEDGYTYLPDSLQWQPGAVEAIRRCNDAGHLAIVVTNQSGVARGLYGEDDVARFHRHMQAQLRHHGAHIDAFYFCPYHGNGSVEHYRIANHPDRKPNPGMIRRALHEWSINPDRSVVLGDADSDVAAAAHAGLKGWKVAPGELLPAVERALASKQTSLRGASPAAELARRARNGRDWLFDHALPLWWDKGFDKDADCFHERMSLAGEPLTELPRRIRVQARQTAVFARAGMMGWDGPWRGAVEAGVRTLTQRGLREDGGTRYLLSSAGVPVDHRRDLYDLAFVLFGLGEAATALGGDANILAAAADLSAWVDRYWRHPHGGYLEGDIDQTPPRRQNPHMHMLEAYLSLFQASANSAYLARASTIAELFERKFFDQRFGALPEFFDDTWHALPEAGDSSLAVEPGHQFEWSWLLHRLKALGGPDLRGSAERLRLHAEIYGLDAETGVVWDQIYIDGCPRRRSTRLWPQTERLKASLARFEQTLDPLAARAACQAFDVLFRNHLGTDCPGVWIERCTEDREPVAEAAPASSFYHVMLALAELARVAGAQD